MIKEVIKSQRFAQDIKKIDKSYLDRLEKLILKIANNPEIGKPMKHNRKGTREIYLAPFRLSYAYNKTEEIILLLELYHKDEQ